MMNIVRDKPCLVLFIAFILAIVGVYPANSQQPAPVIVKKVVYDRFHDRVEALGTLRAKESVELTATVAETVTAIHFEDGQRVEAEDILVEMTNEEEHALIEEELSNITEAKVQYGRIKALVERGAASAAELDQRRRDYETAKARLRALESKMRDRLVIAPFSGKIGLRNISVGTFIEPGDMVATLDDDSVMKLDFSIPSIHLATLKEGLEIKAVSPAFPERTFNGTVSGIDSRVDPATRSIKVRALLPNPEYRLRPGMLMRVELLKNPRDVLVVPEESLVQAGRESAVWTVDRSLTPPIAARRQVTIGARRPGEVEVLAGLKAGEFVIVHGTLRAREGHPVQVIAEDEGDEPLARMLARKKEGSRQ